MTLSLTLHRSSVTRRRASVFSTLAHLHDVWRQRQALKKLNEAQLRDIGVSREQALAESRRAFWDAPSSWQR